MIIPQKAILYTPASMLCVTHQMSHEKFNLSALLPVYVEKNGDLVGFHQSLTD